jgi:hypothetical protein
VKVCWAAACAGTYDITVVGGTARQVGWRRYSVFPPWYTWGTFDSAKTFNATFVCDPYCDFWFDLLPGETYSIQGHLGGDGQRRGLGLCFPGGKWG